MIILHSSRFSLLMSPSPKNPKAGTTYIEEQTIRMESVERITPFSYNKHTKEVTSCKWKLKSKTPAKNQK